MKVALVYDRLNKWGGAERVLLALHKIFPKAPLFTSVYSKKDTPWADDFDVRTSFLQKLGYFQKRNEALAMFMPSAFESFNFDEYNLVISVTSESANGIITKPHTRHICYCLTPTRYLWSGHNEYFKNSIIRGISKPAVLYLRHWDKISARRPDDFIAISTEVKNRIKKYYGRESEIIFPPIMLAKQDNGKIKQGDYFLLVSRLSRLSYYKKVDMAIDAFNKTGLPLKIVGGGPLKNTLMKKANKNIEFLGELTDKELAYYYERCRALVFPGLEDFGLTMAEAQFFGKPVIAYGAGGALDIVREGVTGKFFAKPTAESLASVLKKFNEKSYNKVDIIRNSQRFTFEKFKKDFEKFISKRI
jgi:glycosyltransferase involved in cell wall biosynthesis